MDEYAPATESSQLLVGVQSQGLDPGTDEGVLHNRCITVDEAIETIGFGKFQLGMLAYTGLVWLADAAEMILLSFIGPAAKCEWGLSSSEEGAISSVVFAGVFLGAYAWGIVSDIHGRRLGFIATALFTFLFGMLSAWSPDYWFLLASRAFVGFGLGGAPVVFSLCMEFLPASSRGFWLVFMEVFWTVGSIAEALLAWFILPNYNWRLLVMVSALPFLLLLVFYPALPESPRYLMVKGDKQGAWKVLEQVARVNGAALPSGSLIPSQSSQRVPNSLDQLPLRSPGLNGNADGEEIKQPQPEKSGVGETLMLLFSPELKVTTLLSWSFFFANYFTYYGLVLLTTQLAVKSQTELHGFSDSTADSCLPDGKSGMDISTYKSVLITCFAELPGLIVACLIVERLGRKASLGLLLFGCGICMIPLWTLQTETVTLILMFGARSCIMGAFSILWAFAPELYPTKVRSTGLGFCNSGGRLGGFLCPFVAVGLVESGHRVVAVSLFALVPLLTSIATFLFPVETQGQRLADDIQLRKSGNH
ncbi:unnamed protein product [Sphagnum balticum]